MSISKSNIPYLSHVWNPVVGCTRGCEYCWARRLVKRFKCPACQDFRPHAHPTRLYLPHGKPKVIGLGFLTDLFGPHNWRPLSFSAGDSPEYVSACKAAMLSELSTRISDHPEHTFVTATKCPEGIPGGFDPPANWWLLVTATNPGEVMSRMDQAWRRWSTGNIVLNLEPLVEDIGLVFTGGIHDNPADCPTWYDWCNCLKPAGVIVGGMSGPKAQPMHPDWVRSIRDECAAAGVPFYFKQWSDAKDLSGARPYHPSGNPVLDGRTHRELPWTNR